VRFSATSSGFDPRLPVISAQLTLRAILTFVMGTVSPLIPKVRAVIPPLGGFLPACFLDDVLKLCNF
jgi:hypothetical protein